MPHKYMLSTIDGEKTAKAAGVSLPISLKQSVEISNATKNKSIEEAKKILQEVVEEKRAIPYTRFNKDTGHKTGIGPGRYPQKACAEILKVVQNAEANAQFKGLNTANLVVRHIAAQSASRPYHHGRKRRRKMKRTTIEVILEEKPTEKSKK